MEAMAIGRPVLAADISGNRSLIQNGDNWWLYDGEADFRRLVLLIRENDPCEKKRGVTQKKNNDKFFTSVGSEALFVTLS